MLSYAVERLVERGQALLAIEDKEGVPRSVERRGALKLPRGEQAFRIAHAQDAAGLAFRDEEVAAVRPAEAQIGAGCAGAGGDRQGGRAA